LSKWNLSTHSVLDTKLWAATVQHDVLTLQVRFLCILIAHRSRTLNICIACFNFSPITSSPISTPASRHTQLFHTHCIRGGPSGLDPGYRRGCQRGNHNSCFGFLIALGLYIDKVMCTKRLEKSMEDGSYVRDCLKVFDENEWERGFRAMKMLPPGDDRCKEIYRVEDDYLKLENRLAKYVVWERQRKVDGGIEKAALQRGRSYCIRLGEILRKRMDLIETCAQKVAEIPEGLERWKAVLHLSFEFKEVEQAIVRFYSEGWKRMADQGDKAVWSDEKM
jgi:hypothetical protein